ncbi:MAG TPA: ParB/RepB/Spo0J family partition protein [Pseudolabrys sp.]|nr:ParB/RepB/Spo0J family partition protein [Pseudolabrys sp.]
MAEHKRLGRGLAALIGDVGEEAPTSDTGRKPRRAPIENLKPNPRNPRRIFTDAELNELTSSIKEHGIIQPIVVRVGDDNGFEIIAGERRWRAAQRAGLHDVPIAIVEATDAQSLELAIVENVQRADLNALEEAAGYVALMEQCGRTQEQVAQIVGKSRPHVANTMRLLKLDPPVQHFVRSGKLSAGHARVLVGVPDAEQIAWHAMEREMSVRELEEFVREDRARHAIGAPDVTRSRAKPVKDADTRALEKRLSDALGLAVAIDHRGERGTLHIKYRDLDQLDGVVRKLEG